MLPAGAEEVLRNRPKMSTNRPKARPRPGQNHGSGDPLGHSGDMAISDATAVESMRLGDQIHVTLRGTLDEPTARELDEAVARELDDGGRSLAVDCTALDFVDCSGIDVLQDAVHRLGHERVRLANPSPLLRTALEALGFDRCLHMSAGGATAAAAW